MVCFNLCIIPSKAESLGGVSCRGRGGVSAGVGVLLSLETDDGLDFFLGTVYKSAGDDGVAPWGEEGVRGGWGSPLDERIELRDVF